MSDEIKKGGPGSGQKGHTTGKPIAGPLPTATVHHEVNPKDVHTVRSDAERKAAVAARIAAKKKRMYKAQERPYTEDINELVEKGGVGSGIRGHKTPRKELTREIKRVQQELHNSKGSGKGYEHMTQLIIREQELRHKLLDMDAAAGIITRQSAQHTKARDKVELKDRHPQIYNKLYKSTDNK